MNSALCAGKKRRKKFMARPTGLQSKLKDNSKRNYRAREEWKQGKKLGRPHQQFNAELNTWAKIMLPTKVAD